MPGKRDECVHAVDGRGKQGLLVGEAATLADLSHLLTDALGQQVIDKTGISGKYDFSSGLRWKRTPWARWAGSTRGCRKFCRSSWAEA